ncbi:MAG: ABC transporter permease [Candidatus Saccharimonadales bacterium]
MKFWDIIVTANANLARSKVRTTLTVIAIFIGAFTITLTAGVNAGVNDYIDTQLGSIGGENILTVQAHSEGRSGFEAGPQEYDPTEATSNNMLGLSLKLLTTEDVEKISKIDGIKQVVPQVPVAAAYIQHGDNGKKYNFTVSQMVDGFNFETKVGVVPNNETDTYEIALYDGYAEPLGFTDEADAIGKTVTIAAKSPLGVIKTIEAKVVGVQMPTIIGGGSALVNNALNSAIVDITTEGTPADIKEQYLVVVTIFEDNLSPEQRTEIKNKIDNMGYLAQSTDDTIGTVSSVINAITVALIGFGMIALIAAVFGVVNTLYMAVQERTREIGLMKAMGMGGRKVFMLFSVEAILLGFWGSVIGVGVAYGVGQVINVVAKETFLKDLEGFVLMQFPAAYVSVIIVTIMVIAFLAGTLPALRAAKKNPIDALRYE